MKKIMIILAVCCLIFTSCDQKTKAPTATDIQAQQLDNMREEQKKVMEEWDNWDNLTEARKIEILNQRKNSYDKIKADKEVRAALKAKFEEQMDNWDNLTLEERKNAFDLCNPKSTAAQEFIKQYNDSISHQEKE